MALFALSPPFTTNHAAFLLPKFHHPSAAPTFPANSHDNSTAAQSKWRANTSFFTGLMKNNRSKKAEAIKPELLEAIQPLDCGAEATPEDQKIIDRITRRLEAVNPTKEQVNSDLLNEKWELIYTTSQPILQNLRPKLLRSRRNFQAINADTLRAQNMESAPFNQVTADLTPLNAKKVCQIGLLQAWRFGKSRIALITNFSIFHIPLATTRITK